MSSNRKYVIRKISYLLSLQIITTVITNAQNLNSLPTFIDIVEHVLYDNQNLAAQSIGFYRNTPKGTYYTGTEQITVRAVSLDYDSDPDVFISTNPSNQFPTNSSNSDIACARKGSETCVIPQGLFTINQPIYIGVSCLRKCTYSLKIWFTKTIDITDSNRQQTRLPQASTHILRYFVPDKVSGSQTTSVTITVEPDSDYTPIDMMFSLNSDIYIIEERPAMASSKTGTTLKFSSNDPQWCTSCYIYVVLNIYNEDRYYFTTISRSINDPLNSLLPAQVYVNPFTQECYSYFLLQNQFNFRVDVEGLSGVADLYIATGDFPSDPTSSRIKIRASQGDQRGLYWSQADKQNYMQAVTGNYYVCFYAYTSFAATVQVTETAQTVQNFAYDGQVLTMFMNSNTYKYFIYNSFPTNANGVISIYFELQQMKQGDSLPQVYYAICGNADPTTCSMSNDQALSGKGSTLMMPSNQGTNFGMIDLKVTTSTCPKSGCSFLFSFVNINSQQKVVSIMISSKFQAPADINLDSNYKNSLDEGQYFYYKIDPAINYGTQPWIKSLKIRMRTVRGDADLYFSFNNSNPTQQQSDFRSQTADAWDAITIYDEGQTLASNQLNKVLYFSVYANSYCQYFLDFKYETYPVFDQNLQTAVALSEATPIQEVLPTEQDEKLYEYRPWWGERENRTIVILADTIVNNILLYGAFNAYPVHFKEAIKDTKDVIAIYGNDTRYNYAGSFYVRARPDFGLQDLLSNRQYIYNMFAFSMTPASNVDQMQNAFETMDLSRDYQGFANNSGKIYQDYRYFQINTSATYNITMRRMPGMGSPIFFVSMLDSNSNNNWAPRALNNHFASQPAPWANISQQNLTLTVDMRTSKSPRCGTIYQSLQGDGSQVCYIAISVTCNSSVQCAWRLKIDIVGINGAQFMTAQSSTTFTPVPPSPIFTDGFMAGRVSNQQVNYHFIPVDYNKVNEVTILLNKTRIYRSGFSQNGDSMLIANIQSDILEPTKGYSYFNWVYPTWNNKAINSQTNQVTWPEVLQVCNSQMKLSCDGKRGCGIIVGIVGLTKNLWSSYRLKAFMGTNKLQLDNPIRAYTKNTTSIAGFNNFDYYWFVINDQAFYKGAQFDYQVSLGVDDDGLDPDLYITLMDGREPTLNDYEYKSEIIGADSIRISYSDSIWQQNQWDPTAGVIVVVGVYTPTPMNYNLVLTKVTPDNGSAEMNMTLISLGQTLNIKLDQLPNVQTIRGFNQLYYMYNWGTKNFDITLSFSQGNGSIMINRVGQLDSKNSLYTGTPKNVNNSRISMDIQEGNYQTISLNGRDCFTCWYFIRVVVNTGNATSFRLTISERADSGGQFGQIQAGSVTNIVVPNGSFDKRKFMLESMDGWTLNAQIAFGQVNMFVGLNPDTVSSGGHIWQGQSNGQALSVNVRQVNDNFYFGTFYYVYFQSTGGQDASLRLTLQQTRSISYIGNNNDFTYQIKHPLFNNWQMSQKYLFQTTRELVKSMVFQVNGTQTSGVTKYHRVNITIRSLTPNFYPVIYLKKIGQNKQATSFSSFTFPNFQSNDFALGQNPFTTINQTRFVFNFTGATTDPWTYYTMVIYQNTWGLTDQKKSEFSIRINADDVDKCWFFQNCTTYTPIVASSLTSLHESQPLSNKQNVPQSVETTEPVQIPDLWSSSYWSDQAIQFGENINKFGHDLKEQFNALQFLQ